MAKKLWYKGFDVNKKIEKFLANDISYDQKLVHYDCKSSIAHAKMLKKIGVIDDSELEKIVECLNQIIELDKKGNFLISLNDEDVHTKIENFLTEKLGDTGKKIHTYRSRNDQVLVVQRLYNKDMLEKVKEFVKNLCFVLLDFSKRNEFVPLPGYTHRQKAMLSSAGLWGSSFIESLLDDVKFLDAAYELNDQSPLGSAASYGVPADIDRKFTAKELGFSKVMKNTLYCQNSRGKIESMILSALSQIMLTLSKISSDIIFFSGFGYLSLGDDVSTGSSIMPQKKNPDVCEMIKANSSIIIGYESIIKNTIKDLASGYNKETQNVKEFTMKSFETVIDSIEAMGICIDSLKVNEKNCRNACTKELFAADLAYEHVKKGIPFRDAYRKAADEIGSIEIPDLKEALKKRVHIGGAGNLCLDELEKEIEKI
ncbi:argininosuccinate lyase [Candidatus Woesearchaeota archaeon]|nr:argininosuccinate lyase [Candidatus Woesearchaeota archaeon]